MKKYVILGIIMMLFGSVSAQKKELRNAGKELDKGNFEKVTINWNKHKKDTTQLIDKLVKEYAA